MSGGTPPYESEPNPEPEDMTRVDRAVAVALLVVMVIVVGGLFVFSRFGLRGSDCGPPSDCGAVMFGVWMVDWLPVLILIVAFVVTAMRWRQGRTVFWVPLLGVGLLFAVPLAAGLLTSAAG